MRPRPSWTLSALAVPLAFAAVKLALHAFAILRYGWFRDELYYVACSKHLAWGYVDHPPLSIALLAASRALLGDSLVALRTLPALAGAVGIVVIGLLVRALGGGRLAQALACLCAVLAPVYLLLDHLYTMNAFDQLLWTLAAWLLVRALDEERPTLWMALGIVMGLGLLNKISMMWFGGALFAGLLLTPHRRALGTPWPWLAGALALAMFVPHLVWQAQNGWPTLEFMRNATQLKMTRTPLAEFVLQQVLVMNPATLPVWLGGLVWCLRSSRWRILGLMFLAVALLLVASGTSRPNYLAVAYPMLLAAGGVAIERLTAARGRTWARAVVIAAVALLGAPVVPMGLPVLPVEVFIDYQRALGIRTRSQERTAEAELPQHYADMFGWEEMAERVARVYHGLPPEERAKCGIYADNYGEAGAIDYFGQRWGLPPALSGHNSYWLWGPRGVTGEVLIALGGSRADQEANFRSVTLADSVRCEHCMPYERGLPIWVGRGLRMPLRELWPRLRMYI